MKKFYIISTGRCGTTFLSELIEANDPTLGNTHQQQDSKWLNVRANLAMANRGARSRFSSSLSGKYDHALPPSTVDPLRSVAYTFYLRRLIEKNPKLNEDLVIIHLVRDPRDFVSSFMNWKDRKFSGKIAHHLTPFWMPEPNIIKKWSMSKFEHFCWIWERKNRLFYEELAWFPGYYMYKMEDLRSGSDKLQELLRLLLGKDDVSMPTDEKSINTMLKKDFPYWNNWTSRQAKKLNVICSGMMEEFGYGGEMKWRKLIGEDVDEE